jgi:hypothetical protein
MATTANWLNAQNTHLALRLIKSARAPGWMRIDRPIRMASNSPRSIRRRTVLVDTCSNAATFVIVSRLDEDKAFGSKAGKVTLSAAPTTTAFPLQLTRAHKGTSPTDGCDRNDLLCSLGALWICLRLMPPLWWPLKKEPIPKGQENCDGFWE